MYFLYETPEIPKVLRGELSLLECVGDSSVGEVRTRHIIEIVPLHECVEDVRAQDGEAGNPHCDSVEGIFLGDTEEGGLGGDQAFCFSSDAAPTYTGKGPGRLQKIPAKERNTIRSDGLPVHCLPLIEVSGPWGGVPPQETSSRLRPSPDPWTPEPPCPPR